MDRVSIPSPLRWAVVAWLLLLPSATVAGAASLVQQIGDLSGSIAEAIASEVIVVPLSPLLDPRSTPIILATGKAFVGQSRCQGKRVGGLRPAERGATKQQHRWAPTTAGRWV